MSTAEKQVSETALADQLYDALNAVGDVLLKRGHSLPASVREAACDACNAWLVARGGEPVQELPAEERRAMAIAARETQASKPARAVAVKSLLRPAVHVDVTGERPLPDLVQGVRDFLEACTPKQDLQAAETVLAEERRNAARETQATGVTEAMVEAAMAVYRQNVKGGEGKVGSFIRRTMRAALEAAKRARAAGPKLAYYQTHEPPHCPTCDCAGPDERGELDG